ncbi:MAG: chorismate-binding protein [Oscillospiraceae bacterium]|nr:chorismate-binding protein [Oscillospiraceae bacterium]
MAKITPEQVKKLSAGYKTFPMHDVIPAGELTPTHVFRILRGRSRHCFILESASACGESGRYTFLGFNPKLEITCDRGILRVKNGSDIELHTENPGEYIRGVIADNRGPRVPELPPFTGGLVGYFSYEYIRYSEPKLRLANDGDESFKDVDLMLFDKVIAFDRAENAIILIVNIKTGALDENYADGASALEELARLITEGEPVTPTKLCLTSGFRPMFDKPRFCGMVSRAKEYIREGDIFQVVLSNRYDADAQGSLFGTYEILRESNPSPYMFYFSSDDIEIAGAAPETLVKLRRGVVTTFPLAGTRPRGKTPEEDAALEAELLADPKELAEHNMLVDLGRNDIGKISSFGTVKVEKYLSVERFSHVMHIGSTVTGKIADGKGGIDAINALLPAGTLSGAPKYRACEIIGELEGHGRGIYGGAIGYLCFNGDMDTCIAIRIAFKKNGRVFIRSGAGIVNDSVPEREFEECASKLAAVRLALEKAGGVK